MRRVLLAAVPTARSLLTVAAVIAFAGYAVPASTYRQAQSAAIVPEPAVALAEQFVAEPVSAADRELLLEAHRAGDRNEWSKARKIAEDVTHEFARRTITWRYLVDESTSPSFDQIVTFLEEHPGWPREEALIRRAEVLMPRTWSAKRVIAWYAGRPPLGKTGMVRLGQALIDTGKEADGRQLVATAWIDYQYTEAGELNFLELYAPHLSDDEHVRRFETLFARGATVDAQRQLKRLKGTEQVLARARIALRKTGEKALRGHRSLPASVKNDPRYRVEYARLLRQSGKREQAWSVMAQITPETRVDPVMSWKERQILARQALEAQRPQLAYALASQHSLLRGAEFSEAEFLSGWIALTRLNAKEQALQHFERTAEAVTKPISRARALYWVGRAHDAMRRPDVARAAYEQAARHHATFYGQLSLAQLDRGAALRLASAREADDGEAKYLGVPHDERLQALSALETLGQWKLAQTFATHLANEFDDAASLTLLADIVARSGDLKNALRVAKLAAQKDVVVLAHSAPLLDVPETDVEKALVLGLTRQESEFDAKAKSPVGASGLMQLMPGTAKEVAHWLDMTYSKVNLTDPATNMRLGSTYLARLLDRWSGSYVLSIASYNAGPGNVNKWLRLYGDPRKGEIDPIDWIEAIPFAETRNYVQRVLENTQLYRVRLAADENPVLAADLERGTEQGFVTKISAAMAP